MAHALLQWADRKGYTVGWTPAAGLEAIESDIRRRRETGEITAAFAAEHLSFEEPPFTLAGDDGTASARDLRVLVVIAPRPAHRVWFQINGARTAGLLPPTYERYRPMFEQVRHELGAVLGGTTLRILNVPHKQLAARMGLVRYGRTNITYAASVGSYLQILAYMTDAQLPEELRRDLREPKLLDECADCGVCVSACPTGAIDDDRMLLHVERCVTLMNESAAAWPSWLPAGVHTCLIGCLACQEACPANPPLPIADSGVVFDEKETEALVIEAEHTGPAWDRIRAKLDALGQPYQEQVLGRNLRALLGATAPQTGPTGGPTSAPRASTCR